MDLLFRLVSLGNKSGVRQNYCPFTPAKVSMPTVHNLFEQNFDTYKIRVSWEVLKEINRALIISLELIYNRYSSRRQTGVPSDPVSWQKSPCPCLIYSFSTKKVVHETN